MDNSHWLHYTCTCKPQQLESSHHLWSYSYIPGCWFEVWACRWIVPPTWGLDMQAPEISNWNHGGHCDIQWPSIRLPCVFPWRVLFRSAEHFRSFNSLTFSFSSTDSALNILLSWAYSIYTDSISELLLVCKVSCVCWKISLFYCLLQDQCHKVFYNRCKGNGMFVIGQANFLHIPFSLLMNNHPPTGTH